MHESQSANLFAYSYSTMTSIRKIRTASIAITVLPLILLTGCGGDDEKFVINESTQTFEFPTALSADTMRDFPTKLLGKVTLRRNEADDDVALGNIICNAGATATRCDGNFDGEELKAGDQVTISWTSSDVCLASKEGDVQQDVSNENSSGSTCQGQSDEQNLELIKSEYIIPDPIPESTNDSITDTANIEVDYDGLKGLALHNLRAPPGWRIKLSAASELQNPDLIVLPVTKSDSCNATYGSNDSSRNWTATKKLADNTGNSYRVAAHVFVDVNTSAETVKLCIEAINPDDTNGRAAELEGIGKSEFEDAIARFDIGSSNPSSNDYLTNSNTSLKLTITDSSAETEDISSIIYFIRQED